MMMLWHENTFYITGTLGGESTDNWWFPFTEGQQPIGHLWIPLEEAQ